MSKSEDSPQGTVLVLDDPKAIVKKIKSAVTDSGSEVRHDRDEKPGVSNLIEIYGAVSARTIAEVEREFEGKQYGAFKGAVADAVVEFLRPVQERYHALMANPDEVDAPARAGRGYRRRDGRGRPGARNAGNRIAHTSARLELPGLRIGEILGTAVLAVDGADVVTVDQQPARGAPPTAPCEHDRLRAAPVDGHAHADSGGRELVVGQLRVRTRRPRTARCSTPRPCADRDRR